MSEYTKIRAEAALQLKRMEQLQKNLASYIETEGRQLHAMIKRRHESDTQYWQPMQPRERDTRVLHLTETDMQWMIDNADAIITALRPFTMESQG